MIIYQPLPRLLHHLGDLSCGNRAAVEVAFNHNIGPLEQPIFFPLRTFASPPAART